MKTLLHRLQRSGLQTNESCQQEFLRYINYVSSKPMHVLNMENGKSQTSVLQTVCHSAHDNTKLQFFGILKSSKDKTFTSIR